ncbi:hypothetical protein LCGC14_1677930 [marine sediment metagenome]|uniref:Uncharacterized protein n=1 Tax=marine sediment metagenome TaxID=412755 RepID=A0A0F9K557_9ZZZZ
MAIMNPVQCPDCQCYETEMLRKGVYLCQECGMVWAPGDFYGRRRQDGLNLYDATQSPNDENRCLEDIDPGSGDPTPCPLCRNEDVVGLVDILGDLAGRYMCRKCACEFSVLEGGGSGDEEEDVHGIIAVCPHCMSTDSIQIYGDNEWCGECWLDPNELDQSSPEIAKLYRGGIKRALEKDVWMLRPELRYGKFIRQVCGPRCSFAESCPQDTGIMIRCFNEELSSEEEDNEIVGKRKRGRKSRKNRSQKQIMKHNRKAHKHVPSKVAFLCSKGGLLEKMILYGIADPDTEQPGNTGGQSGA